MSEKCSHGALEVHPSNNTEFPGFARCVTCGAFLADYRDLLSLGDKLADGLRKLLDGTGIYTSEVAELVSAWDAARKR